MRWCAVIMILAGCGAHRIPTTPTGTNVRKLDSNVYLRSAFDSDPRLYLGRFVPKGRGELDETAAMPLACSDHFDITYIEASGHYDEVFQASGSAALAVKAPIGSARANANSAEMVRVEYQLQGKLVAKPRDGVAFEACCKSAADRCTERYIGEFLIGTGTVYSSTEAHGDASAQGVVVPVRGSAEMAGDSSWHRTRDFEQPTYFAFRTTQLPWGSGAESATVNGFLPPVRHVRGSLFTDAAGSAVTTSELMSIGADDSRIQAAALRHRVGQYQQLAGATTILVGLIGAGAAAGKHKDRLKDYDRDYMWWNQDRMSHESSPDFFATPGPEPVDPGRFGVDNAWGWVATSTVGLGLIATGGLSRLIARKRMARAANALPL